MSKLVVLVVCGMIVAPFAFAQTNVLSQNAVGYVKVAVPADGGLVLVSYDFQDIDGNPLTLDQVLGLDYPNGTAVFKWDRAGNQYDLPAMTMATQPFPPFLKQWSRTDIPIDRGDAFWIQNAPGEVAVEGYLLGEVPDAATTLVSPATGFTGYPYPAVTNFSETALAQAAPLGTTVFKWDSVAEAWSLPGNTKSQQPFPPFAVTWSVADASFVVNPGVGMFVDLAGNPAFDATEPKPYSWP